jgi:hypothetical protein
MSAPTHPTQPQLVLPTLFVPRTLFTTSTAKTKRIPCHFNHLHTLLQKHWDATRAPFSPSTLNSSTLSRNFFRIRTYSRSPCFSRNQPKSSARNSSRINTYKIYVCNPFRIRTYEKTRGVGDIMLTSLACPVQTVAAVPLGRPGFAQLARRAKKRPSQAEGSLCVAAVLSGRLGSVSVLRASAGKLSPGPQRSRVWNQNDRPARHFAEGGVAARAYHGCA